MRKVLPNNCNLFAVMPKEKLFYLFVVLAVAASFISCSEEQEQKVDQQYLDAQDYSAFKKNTDQELERKNNSKHLGDNLAKISDCGSVSNFEAPFSIDWEVLKELSTEADACNTEEESQRLTLLGEQTMHPRTIRWFLLEHPSAYRNAEVIVATFSGKKLRSFSTVGVYEKIPAHNIQTNITVNSKGNTVFIRSETIRDINYPLEQKNTITADYEIDADGGINER